MMDIEQHVSLKISNDPNLKSIDKFNEVDESELLVSNRPKLKKYLNFGNLDFHAIFGYKSIRHDGREVALLRNIRDPLNHDILTNHVWIILNSDMSKTLNNLPKETPVRIHGRVVLYDGDTKVGVHAQYINLVRGMRTYTIESKKVSNHGS